MVFLREQSKTVHHYDRLWSRAMHIALLAFIPGAMMALWRGPIDPVSGPKTIVAGSCLVIALLSWGMRNFLRRELRLYPTLVGMPLIVFVAALLFSASLSLSVWHSFFGQLHVFTFSVFEAVCFALWTFLALQDIGERGQALHYHVVMLMTLASGLVISLVQTIIPLQGAYWPLFAGTPSTMSAIAAIAAVIALAHLLGKEQGRALRVFAVLTLLISLAHLVRLDFTIGWALWFTGCLFLFIVSMLRAPAMHSGWLVATGVGLVCGLLGLTMTIPLPIRAVLPTEIALGIHPSLDIVERSIEDSGKQALVGAGPATFGLVSRMYRSPAFNLDERLWQLPFDAATNTILTLGGEIGLIGLLSFAVIGMTALRLWQGFANHTRPRLLGKLWQRVRTVPDQHYWLVSAVERARLSAMVFVLCTGALFVINFDMTLWMLWWFSLVILVGTSMMHDKNAFERIRHVHLRPRQQFVFGSGVIVAVVVVLSGVIALERIEVASRAFTLYTAMVPENATSSTLRLAEVPIERALWYWPHEGLFWQKRSELRLREARLMAADNQNPDAAVSLLADAIHDATRATELEPASADAWNTLATLYAYSRSLAPTAMSKSYEAMQVAIAREPNNALLRWRLATLYESDKAWGKAEDSAYAALALKMNYVDAYITLAQIYDSAGERDKAISVFHEANDYIASSPIALFEYGRLLYNRGQAVDLSLARSAWEEAVRLQPNYADALFALRELAQKTGDRPAAARYTDRLRAIGAQGI